MDISGREYARRRAAQRGSFPPLKIRHPPSLSPAPNWASDPLPLSTGNDVDNPRYFNLQRDLLAKLQDYGTFGIAIELYDEACGQIIGGSSKNLWKQIKEDYENNRHIWIYLCQHNAEFWKHLIQCTLTAEAEVNPLMEAYLASVSPEGAAGGYINIVADANTGCFMTPDELVTFRANMKMYTKEQSRRPHKVKEQNDYAAKVDKVFYGHRHETLPYVGYRRHIDTSTHADQCMTLADGWMNRVSGVTGAARGEQLYASPIECGWSIDVIKRVSEQKKGQKNANRLLSVTRAVMTTMDIPIHFYSFLVTRAWRDDKEICDLAECIPTAMTSAMESYNLADPGLKSSYKAISQESADRFFGASKHYIFNFSNMPDNALREVLRIREYAHEVDVLVRNNAYAGLSSLERSIDDLGAQLMDDTQDLQSAEETLDDLLQTTATLEETRKDWLEENIGEEYKNMSKELRAIHREYEALVRKDRSSPKPKSVPNNWQDECDRIVKEGLNQDGERGEEGSTLRSQLAAQGSVSLLPVQNLASIEERLGSGSTNTEFFKWTSRPLSFSKVTKVVKQTEKSLHAAMDALEIGNLKKAFDIPQLRDVEGNGSGDVEGDGGNVDADQNDGDGDDGDEETDEETDFNEDDIEAEIAALEDLVIRFKKRNAT